MSDQVRSSEALQTLQVTADQKVEAALKNSEAKMSAIFRAAPTGIGVVSNRLILEVNERFCELTGYTEDELIGHSARIIYPSDEDFETVGREKYRQIEQHGTGTVETRFRRKDGRIIDVLLSSTPLDPDQIARGIVFTVIDITARKQAENVLRESEEKFSKAFYSSPSLLFICEFETGIFVDVNNAYCAITGYDREEMIGRSSIELGLISSRTRADILQRMRASGRVQKMELQITGRNGDRHFCLFSAETIQYRGKSCLIYSGVDLTERKLAEDARQRSEESLRLVVKGGNLGAWDRDLLTGKVVWNQQLYRLLGRNPDGPAITGETFFDYIHADDLPRIRQHVEEVLQSGAEFADEFRVVREDGDIRWLASHGRIYRNAAGEPIRMAGVNYDITERKQTAQALRESEEKYRNLFDSIDQGFCIVEMIFDPNGNPQDYRFLEVNPAFEKHTGLRHAVGKRMGALKPHHDELWCSIFGGIALTGQAQRFEKEAKHLEGRWLDVYAFRVGRPRERKVAIIFTDISRRKRDEAVLRDYQKNLEAEVANRTAEIEKQYQRLEEMNRAIKQMAQHTIRTLENDRKALSKEIHDSIGGSLAAIKMLLETRIQHAGQPPQRITSLETIVDHLADTLKESKRISHRMRPLALDDLGLAAALSETVTKFKEFYPHIAVDLQIRILQDDISDEIKTVLYRVIQEALNNIGKHSGADQVRIAMADSKNRISLKIVDNGCGFDVSKTLESGRPLQGYGLLSMKERVEICKGNFTVASSSGAGTRLTASIPKTR
jgi:PAS domain S-box-containing protein